MLDGGRQDGKPLETYVPKAVRLPEAPQQVVAGARSDGRLPLLRLDGRELREAYDAILELEFAIRALRLVALFWIDALVEHSAIKGHRERE
jgi:hypothetical protein